MKQKTNKSSKNLYKVLWSYYDCIGINSGLVDIRATTRKEAEKVFYKLNRPYVASYDKKSGKPNFNPSGYVCEAVLTEEEWIREGKPTSV